MLFSRIDFIVALIFTTSLSCLANTPLDRSDDPTCFFCSLEEPTRPVHLDRICGPDPYDVVCANKDQDRQLITDIEIQTERIIREVEQLSAQSMGFESVQSLVLDRLNSAGIEINSRHFSFRQLLRSGETWRFSNNTFGENFLISGDRCRETYDNRPRASSTIYVQSPTEDEISELRSQLDGIRQMSELHSQTLDRLRQYDLTLYYNEIVSICRRHENNDYRSARSHPAYARFRDDCRDIRSIQQTALNILRRPPSIQKEREVQEFTRRYRYMDLLPSPHLPSSNSTVYETDPMKRQSNLLTQLIERESRYLNQTCNNISDIEHQVVASIIESALIDIHTHRVFVETLYSRLFPEAALQSFRRTANQARESIIRMLPQIFPNRSDYQNITNYLYQIQISLPLIPEGDLYETRDGHEFLAENKIGHRAHQFSFLDVLFNPELRELRRSNAFYRTQSGVDPQIISPLGAVFRHNQINPATVFYIAAHEFGHAIDPNLSFTNGLGMTQTYEEFDNCFSSGASIAMEPHQRGETFADMVAGFAIADQLQQLPQNLRRAFFVESMKYTCRNDDMHSGSMNITSGVHPAWSIRLNGIMAANPIMRESMNCRAEDNFNYRICPSSE
jgi:hypothetical protein